MKIARWPISLATALVFALAGCNAEVSPQARLLLEGGKQSLRRGDAPAALANLDAFLKDNAGSRLAGEAHYYRGRARLAGGDRAGARADFAQAAGLLADRLPAAEALLALGLLTEESGDLLAAERLYRQAVEKLELGQKPSDEALCHLACVLQRQGRWTEADAPLDRLIHLFADTPLAQEARKKVRCTAWTIQTELLSSRPAAAEAAAELAKAGLPASVREVIEDGRLAFSVQVGRYGVYAQAYAALGDIRAKAKDAAIVETR